MRPYCVYSKIAAHHDEIVEEEDFSLVRRLFLGLVDVRHLKEPTAAHQPPVGDGKNLRKKVEWRRVSVTQRMDGK